jgi:SAM-dependent methyltransferase
MPDYLTIPDKAVPYILFQRTAYLRFPVAPIYRQLDRLLPFETPFYNLVVAIESRLRASRIKALYRTDMRREYLSIRPYLPQTCRAILDIGCGVAGIDVHLARHYSPHTPHFYLLDKSQVENRVFYMFRPRAAFYNSLEVAAQLLTSNGIPLERVHPIEANDKGTVGLSTEIDLAISLLAWGFHFPIETYLDKVCSLLSPQGTIVLDVRKCTDGLDVLKHSFRQIRVISETPKQHRVVAHTPRVR